MDIAKTLLRTVVRAFYGSEHILIIDALALHSTLTDLDLAHVLGIQPKALRRLCGKLKEDGLISVHSRGEKKEGAPPTYFHGSGGGSQPKERLFYRDWFYLNYHRAIDSLKYRLWKLNKHIESQGAPTTEKKDLVCPRCKSTYTELEVMDNIGDEGEFLCHRCDHALDPAEEKDGPSENESMKRMNDQLATIVALMRQIDSTNVPENDFDTALSFAVPIQRSEGHIGPKMQPVDDVKPSLASAKGLAMAPEKVSVSVSEDGVVKEDPSEAQAKRDKDAKANLLPEWISKSTVNGEITAVGAREAAQRREREGLVGIKSAEDEAEDKKTKDVMDNAVMDEYWKELRAEQEREQAEKEAEEEEEEDEEDDDEFEDVIVHQSGVAGSSNGASQPAAVATPDTSGMVSSNATDDEAPLAKKVRLDPLSTKGTGKGKEREVATKADLQEAAKDAVSDEDEFEFEDV